MKQARLRSFAALFLASLVALGVSCLLPGFEVAEGPPDIPDAESDATDAAEEPMCGHASPPLPPSGGTSGGTIEFTVALQTIDLGEAQFEAKTTPPGLDLDGLCTCLGESRSCVPPPNTMPTEEDYCDYDQGIDNSSAQLFYRFSKTLGADKFGSSFFNQATAQGKWSVLLRVAGYNGEADDPNVSVSMYVAGDLGAAPLWDGSDAWPVSSQSIVGGDVNSPVAIDPNAYVSGNVLVASLPEAQLDLPRASGAVFRVKLVKGVMKGTIVSDAGAYRIDQGVLAARWKTGDIFAAGWDVCKDSVFYLVLRDRICQSMDASAAFLGPNDVCDALSFGMAFSAQPATMGPVYDTQTLSTCMAGFDPAGDNCDPPPP